MLTRCIHVFSRGESYRGKLSFVPIGVGHVAMNASVYSGTEHRRNHVVCLQTRDCSQSKPQEAQLAINENCWLEAETYTVKAGECVND